MPTLELSVARQDVISKRKTLVYLVGITLVLYTSTSSNLSCVLISYHYYQLLYLTTRVALRIFPKLMCHTRKTNSLICSISETC